MLTRYYLDIHVIQNLAVGLGIGKGNMPEFNLVRCFFDGFRSLGKSCGIIHEDYVLVSVIAAFNKFCYAVYHIFDG